MKYGRREKLAELNKFERDLIDLQKSLDHTQSSTYLFEKNWKIHCCVVPPSKEEVNKKRAKLCRDLLDSLEEKENG